MGSPRLLHCLLVAAARLLILAGTEAAPGKQYQSAHVVKIEGSEEEGIRAIYGPQQNNAVKGKAEGPDQEEWPCLRQLSNHIRNLNKKLREIEKLQQEVKNGKVIDGKQYDKVRSKHIVILKIKEAEESKKLLINKAIAEKPSSKNPENTCSSAKKDPNVDESGQLQGTTAVKSLAKKDATADESEMQVDGTEGTTADESGHMQSPKNDEAGAPRATHTSVVSKEVSYLVVAQAGSDQSIENGFYNFMKEFTVQGDVEVYYRGEALALVGRQHMNVKYSHLCEHDNKLAMKICESYDRLQPRLTRAVKRFAKDIFEGKIKGPSPHEAQAIIVKLEALELVLVEKPTRHQMLDRFLQPPIAVMATVEVYGHRGNPMYTPSPIGLSLLIGVLEDLVNKHVQGQSHDGQFNRQNIEVYDYPKPFRFVTSTPIFRYDPGSQEMAKAAANDFSSYANSFISLFKAGETYPPYMREFMAVLTNVPHGVLLDQHERKAFHEFILHHMATKPLLVRANLICGIHSACKSFEKNDPDAPFKDSIRQCGLNNNAGLKFWTDTVVFSDNKLMKKALERWLEKGKWKIGEFEKNYEAMITYLRVLYKHGSDYTKDKKEKNKMNGKNCNRRKNRIQIYDYASDSIFVDVPQRQRLKKLDELELCGGHHLGAFVLEIIYSMLKTSAMTGMMSSVWDVYKGYKR